MGSNESSDWHNDFQIIDSSNSIKKAVHKHTKSRNQILTLFPSNEESLQIILDRIKLRTIKSSPYIQPFHGFWHSSQFTACGGKSKIELIFKIATPLEQYLTYRRVKNQRFTKEEIEYVIWRVANGLNDLKDFKQEYGAINFSNVVIDDGIKLKDPFLVREEEIGLKKSKKIQGFPSPQKLYTYYDTLSTFEQHTSDLFSLGILALQLIYPHQNLSGLYKNTNSRYLNCAIDINQLKAYINGVTEEPLKSYVLTLTNEQPNKRREVYYQLNKRQIKSTGLKLLNQNPYQMVQQQIINVQVPQKIEKPHAISLIAVNREPQGAKILNGNFRENPPTSFVKFEALSTPYKINQKINDIGFPTPQFKPATELWKPSQIFESSYRNVSLNDNHNFTPINKIIGTEFTSFKSPKFAMPISPQFPDLQTISANNNGFTTKTQYRMEKVSPKYIDSTYRTSLLTRNQPERQEKSRQFPQEAEQPNNHQAVIINQPQKYEVIQASELIQLMPIERKVQQVLSQYVKQSTEDISIQKKSIIQHISNQQIAQNTEIQLANDKSQTVSVVQTQKKSENIVDKDGFVIEEYDIGTRYQGFKKNGMRNGQGQFIYKEGSKYRGQWKDNKMEGYGTLYYPNGAIAYEGEWQDDEFDGFGTVYNDHPSPIKGGFDYTNFNTLDEEWIKYEGQLKKDAKDGKGKLYLTNGEIYNGLFQNDFVHGEGEFKRSNGTIIKAMWCDGLLKKILYQ